MVVLWCFQSSCAVTAETLSTTYCNTSADHELEVDPVPTLLNLLLVLLLSYRTVREKVMGTNLACV